MPGPDSRQNIVNNRDTRRFRLFDQAHVKPRIINTNKGIGSFFRHRVDKEGAQLKKEGDLFNDLTDTDDAEILYIIYNPYSRYTHELSSHTEELDVGVKPAKCPGQAGAVQVA